MNTVVFNYKNHRGEITTRNVIPDAIEFIAHPGYDYQPGWFLSGFDKGKNARRSFALSHIVFSPENKFYSLKLGPLTKPVSTNDGSIGGEK